jgi:hypothetical protein
MTALLVAVAVAFALIQAVTFVAVLVLADRRDQRAATERAWLLQRIQAPQVAVAQFDPTDDEPEQPDEPTEEEMRVFHSEQDEILHQLGRL